MQHGKPSAVGACDSQPTAREGQVGPFGVAEGLVVPLKSGNAGGGKEPWFQNADEAVREKVIGIEPSNTRKDPDTATKAIL